VGATWLLSRAPGELGTYLALTAGSVSAADAIAVGLSDAYVPSERIPKLLTALETTEVAEVIALLAEDAGAAPLTEARSWIDDAFAASSVSDIITRLRELGNADADKAAETIGTKSPTAL